MVNKRRCFPTLEAQSRLETARPRDRSPSACFCDDTTLLSLVRQYHTSEKTDRRAMRRDRVSVCKYAVTVVMHFFAEARRGYDGRLARTS